MPICEFPTAGRAPKPARSSGVMLNAARNDPWARWLLLATRVLLNGLAEYFLCGLALPISDANGLECIRV